MPFLALLRPFLPYILCAIAVGGAYLYADEFWHNAVAVRAERELDGIKTGLAKEALRQKENQLRAAQNLVQSTQNNAQTRTTRFDAIKTTAVPSTPVSAAAVSVLNDAARAANASGPPGESDKAAPASAGDTDLKTLTDWGKLVLEIHAECRDRVAEWQKWYGDLKNGN